MGIIKRFASENYVAEQITTEINNTVVNFENTAGDLVSAHNVATDAHADIREQISQLSEDKANKSGLTLGVHTDGLVYIFVDGAPHGNGLDIKADVVGDVFGYVDEDNVIILNGTLANGTYTIKYEMDNGRIVEIGDLELDSNSEVSKGNLADPTSADWLTDKRLAMAYGYTKDSEGNIFTNYIPVKLGDVIRVKGLNLYGVQNSVSSAIACYSSNTDTSTDSEGALNAYKGGVYTAVTTELEENGVRDQVIQDGNIFTYTILVYNDGTQMADPETSYIRISAPLLEGYTAEEVIITVNEEIPEDDTYWFITNNLANCTTNNTATRVVKGESYVATITAKNGYNLSTVRMTMGGNYIPVENGVINIKTVTGDIVITAVAEVPKGNLADPTSADWQEGYRLSLSEGTTVELAGHTTTNYIPCKVGDVLRVKGLAITGCGSSTINSQHAAKIGTFMEDKTKIGGLYGLMNATDCYGLMVSTNGDISEYTILLKNDGTQTTMTNLKYIRIDGFLMDGYTKNDVIITINEEIENTTKYSVTNNLTNCTNSNSATTVNEGSAYSATITANVGYAIKSVTATMGGSVVTVNDGVINIASVTGDIVITAEAEKEQAADLTNFCVPNGDGWITGGRASSSGADRTDSDSNVLTNYIAVQNGDVIHVENFNIIGRTYSGMYKSDKTAIGGFKIESSGAVSGYIKDIDLTTAGGQFTIDNTNAGYIRICGLNKPPYENIIINIKRNGAWLTTNGSDSSGSGSGDTGSSNYINLLPSAIDTDGSAYGNGKGYVSGYKLSCSSESGTPSATSGAYASGFMPINDNNDVVRIKNVTLHANANINNVIFYNKDKTKIHAIQGVAGGFANLVRVDEGNVYRFSPGSWLSNTQAANIGFFRFSCGGITDETIVTVNEEIV